MSSYTINEIVNSSGNYSQLLKQITKILSNDNADLLYAYLNRNISIYGATEYNGIDLIQSLTESVDHYTGAWLNLIYRNLLRYEHLFNLVDKDMNKFIHLNPYKKSTNIGTKTYTNKIDKKEVENNSSTDTTTKSEKVDNKSTNKTTQNETNSNLSSQTNNQDTYGMNENAPINADINSIDTPSLKSKTVNSATINNEATISKTFSDSKEIIDDNSKTNNDKTEKEENNTKTNNDTENYNDDTSNTFEEYSPEYFEKYVSILEKYNINIIIQTTVERYIKEFNGIVL